ncbi:MAG: rRNA maturation RNase YbeY [Mycoplasmataceae bacterium]|jgi:probable rRNA maturation factor|nr:rRNA maturation RNase YbeY [Mycoplasmataceae bacterium]
MINFQLNANLKFSNKYNEYFKKIAKIVSKNQKNKKEIFFEVNIVSDNKIRSLNKKYRNIDKVTDVLSFSINNSQLIGEIFIAYQYAKKQNKNEIYEICLLFTHGLLHLLGYDHNNKINTKQMFDLQEKIVHEAI